MADTNTYRSVNIPFSGGTVQGSLGQSAVALNSTRIIYARCQMNPNWRMFTIVDTPEGWASPNGNPVVTANRLQEPGLWGVQSGTTSGTLSGFYLERLNDNAFVTAYFNGSNTVTFESWEIDANNVITKTSTANVSFSPSYGYVPTLYTNQMVVAPAGDNTVVLVGATSTFSYSTIVTYNTSTKVLSAPAVSNNSMYTDFSGYQEWYWKPVPGSSRIFVNYRSTGSTTAPTSSNPYPTSLTGQGNMWDTTTSYSSVGAVTGVRGVTGFYDCHALSTTRRASPTSWNSIQYSSYGNTSPAASTLTDQNLCGIVTATYGAVTTDTKPMMTVPIDSNYFWMIDRTNFNDSAAAQAAGTVNVKVVRREDNNFTVQSAASGTSTTGMTVTAPWVRMFYDKLRPRVLSDGSLYWMGTDATTATAPGTKLMWNVIKVPS